MILDGWTRGEVEVPSFIETDPTVPGRLQETGTRWVVLVLPECSSSQSVPLHVSVANSDGKGRRGP